jgi:ketosteroid isomerase-like protein
MTSEGGGITVDVRVSGDLAYVRGTWEATHVPKTGESFKEKSKWVSILQRHPDGTWKTICETWNNNPLPTT